MAFIDRTYVNSYQQVLDFVNWAKDKKFVYNGYTFNPLKWLYYTIEDYKEHFETQTTEMVLFSKSKSQDYVLIKHCPLDFIQEQLKHIYDIEYYSIKNGTSIFDTFNRNDISGQKVKCIKETDFGNKRFHYKSRKRGKRSPLRYWVEINHPNYFLFYDENMDKWSIYKMELYNPSYLSSVCHKKIKTRKALIRNIRKWNLPKGSIVRWIGEYVGDDMEFKIY
jgi:hypothetical protein